MEEQLKSASSKVQSLAAEILEVKEHLAELKACGGAGIRRFQAVYFLHVDKSNRKCCPFFVYRTSSKSCDNQKVKKKIKKKVNYFQGELFSFSCTQ